MYRIYVLTVKLTALFGVRSLTLVVLAGICSKMVSSRVEKHSFSLLLGLFVCLFVLSVTKDT